MTFILRTAAAGLIGTVSYLFVRSALHPHGWGLHSSLSDPENYLAIGIAVIVFGFVLWRLYKQTWGKEQMEQLWDIDD